MDMFQCMPPRQNPGSGPGGGDGILIIGLMSMNVSSITTVYVIRFYS